MPTLDESLRRRLVAKFPRVAQLLGDARAKGNRVVRPLCSVETFQRVVLRIQSLATIGASSLHGDRHWRRVAWLGAHLANEVPTCDPWIVLLFALIHDSQRMNDGHDPEHGHRAARLVRALSKELGLEGERLVLLESACFAHADGDVSYDSTVGVCWDADRLDLWRCGITPDPRYLSTAAALDPRLISWSKGDTTDQDWPELYAMYASIHSSSS